MKALVAVALAMSALAGLALASDVPDPKNLASYYTAWPQPVGSIVYLDGFFKCQGEYALCAFAMCVPIEGSNPPVAECGCYSFNGVNMGGSTAILKANIKKKMMRECSHNTKCVTIKENETPFCESMNSKTMYPGYDYVSTYNPSAWTEATGFSDTTPKLCTGGTVAICYTAACRAGPPQSDLIVPTPGAPNYNATCYCPYYTKLKRPISLASEDMECGPTDPKLVTPTTIIYNGA